MQSTTMKDDELSRKTSGAEEGGGQSQSQSQSQSRSERGLSPTRSFRHEDYNTRRAFLHSYPLQWDCHDDDDKSRRRRLQGDELEQAAAAACRDKLKTKDHTHVDDGSIGSRRKKMMKRQVVVALVVEWGEEKLLVLRRLKRKVAFYLLACHYPTLHLPHFTTSSSTSVLTAR